MVYITASHSSRTSASIHYTSEAWVFSPQMLCTPVDGSWKRKPRERDGAGKASETCLRCRRYRKSLTDGAIFLIGRYMTTYY